MDTYARIITCLAALNTVLFIAASVRNGYVSFGWLLTNIVITAKAYLDATAF